MSQVLNLSDGYILIKDPNGGTDKKIPLDQAVVNETQGAKILGLKRQTLANWRHLGKGPAYHKISTRISYSIPDLLDYMKRHRIDPEVA